MIVSTRTGLTEAEVLAQGVRVLDEESAPGGESLERWLRDEVAAGYDAYMSDPDSAISADDLMRRLRSRSVQRRAVRPE